MKRQNATNFWTEWAAASRRLAKKRVQWLTEHSTSYQLLCWVDSFVLRNPLLRQAPNKVRPKGWTKNNGN